MRLTLTPRELRRARIRLIGREQDALVYLVDGEYIRDLPIADAINLVAGGSSARYRFIPKGEIWIEKILSPREQRATLVHEAAERAKMLRGMPYVKAHVIANRAERAWRNRHRRYSRDVS